MPEYCATAGCQIAACIVNKDGWPLFGLVTYVLPPIVIALIGPPDTSHSKDPKMRWILWMGGFMVNAHVAQCMR